MNSIYIRINKEICLLPSFIHDMNAPIAIHTVTQQTEVNLIVMTYDQLDTSGVLCQTNGSCMQIYSRTQELFYMSLGVGNIHIILPLCVVQPPTISDSLL